MKKAYKVKGMSCEHCKMAVEKALNLLDGIKKAEVNLKKKSVKIKMNKKIDFDTMKKAVKNAGYELIENN